MKPCISPERDSREVGDSRCGDVFRLHVTCAIVRHRSPASAARNSLENITSRILFIQPEIQGKMMYDLSGMAVRIQPRAALSSRSVLQLSRSHFKTTELDC